MRGAEYMAKKKPIPILYGRLDTATGELKVILSTNPALIKKLDKAKVRAAWLAAGIAVAEALREAIRRLDLIASGELLRHVSPEPPGAYGMRIGFVGSRARGRTNGQIAMYLNNTYAFAEESFSHFLDRARVEWRRVLA
jgi:hypothetical protein